MKSSKEVFWLTDFDRLTARQQLNFDKLLDQRLKTGVAWSFREMLRDLWLIPSKRAATVFFRSWYEKVVDTGLKTLISAANAIHDQLALVVNYCTHGITNAVAEGLKSKIVHLNDAWTVIVTQRPSRPPSTSTAVAWIFTHTDPGMDQIRRLFSRNALLPKLR